MAKSSRSGEKLHKGLEAVIYRSFWRWDSKTKGPTMAIFSQCPSSLPKSCIRITWKAVKMQISGLQHRGAGAESLYLQQVLRGCSETTLQVSLTQSPGDPEADLTGSTPGSDMPCPHSDGGRMCYTSESGLWGLTDLRSSPDSANEQLCNLWQMGFTL